MHTEKEASMSMEKNYTTLENDSSRPLSYFLINFSSQLREFQDNDLSSERDAS